MHPAAPRCAPGDDGSARPQARRGDRRAPDPRAGVPAPGPHRFLRTHDRIAGRLWHRSTAPQPLRGGLQARGPAPPREWCRCRKPLNPSWRMPRPRALPIPIAAKQRRGQRSHRHRNARIGRSPCVATRLHRAVGRCRDRRMTGKRAHPTFAMAPGTVAPSTTPAPASDERASTSIATRLRVVSRAHCSGRAWRPRCRRSARLKRARRPGRRRPPTLRVQAPGRGR